VASADARGRFGASTELAPNGALGDIALGAGGATLLVHSVFPSPFGATGDAQVLSSTRPEGVSVFEAPETVAGPEPVSGDGPRASFSPRDGTAVAVWPTHATPSRPAAMRLATRTP
jgi:hypothetical protein